MKECVIERNIIKVNGQTVYSIGRDEKIDEFLTKAYWEMDIKYPKFHKMDNVSKLGVLTSSVLFDSFEWMCEPSKRGIIFTSNSGCQFTDNKYIKEIQEAPESSHPGLFTYTLPSIVMGEICIKHSIQGENIFMITEYFGKSFLYEVAEDMFLYKSVKQCLLGWVELKNRNTYKSHLIVIDKEDIDNINKKN